MTPPKPYARSGDVVTVQRCAFGDDDRGYCGAPATEHLWCQVAGIPEGAQSMTCAEHRKEIDHPVRDRHPVDGPCGLPGTTWIYSHPVGGPGWCEFDGVDWLSAVNAEPNSLEPACSMTPPDTTRSSIVDVDGPGGRETHAPDPVPLRPPPPGA